MRAGLSMLGARLAARNATRRKVDAALVVLGSLLATAVISASFVVGDTLHATIRDGARTRLGPIDEIVLVHRATQLPAALARVSGHPLPDTDGVLAETTATVAVSSMDTAGAGAGPRVAVPDAYAHEVDFDAARRFGGDPDATGFANAGPTPAGSDVVIGADLASELGVRTGEQLDVFAFGETRRLTVRGIVPRLGVAGFHPGFENEARNVFVAPGTLAALAARAPAGSAPPEGRVLVSNRGGVFDGVRLSDAVNRELMIRTAGLGAETIEEKQETLAFADRQGTNFTELFGLIGSFTVAASVLLLVNLFVMLAEERKTELGTLRALGFTRRRLVTVLGLEGLAYAVVAAAAGAVAGTGVGRIVSTLAGAIFMQGRRATDELRVTVDPAHVAVAFAIGLGIALVTVWATCIRIGRLDVVRAIRDAPEPAPRHRRGRVRRVGAASAIAFGAALFGFGVAAREPLAALAGPAVAAWGAVQLVGHLVARRVAISVAAAAVLAYLLAAFRLLPSVFGASGIEVFVEQGGLLVVAGVVGVVANDDLLRLPARVLAVRGGGLGLRLGLANPLTKRVRTGLLVGMYALVVFALTALVVFAAVFDRDAPGLAAQAAGGFDLRVDANPANPVSPARLASQPGVAAVAPLVRAEAQFQTDPDTAAVTQPLTGFDEALLTSGAPALAARDPQYATDEAAWRAVLRSPGLVIVPADFFATAGGPPRRTVDAGQRLTLIDPATGRRHPLTVAGISGLVDPAHNGAMVAASTVPTLVDRSALSRAYVAVDPGVPATEVAAALQRDLLANGVRADTFRSLVDERFRTEAQFIALLEGFLALGFAVGISGLGVVMVRAVRERQREIGTLRAIGCGADLVRRAFVVEASLVAVQGIVVGGALGLVTSDAVLHSTVFGDGMLRFTIPWPALAVIAASVLTASLLAALVPATRASRLAPAVALRTAG